MDLKRFINETMLKLRTCKRAEEAEQVVTEAKDILEANEVGGDERYKFWKDLYDTLGDRNYPLMEEEFKGSFNKIAIITRKRLESFITHENNKI